MAVDRWQLSSRELRANPAYRLLPLETLPTSRRRLLETVGVDLTTASAVLVGESASGLPDKVVDAAGAELFSTLRESGQPSGARWHQLAELVLDGVLQVDSGEGFVCGPMAYELLTPPVEPSTPPGRLGGLSRAALAYAERLRLSDVEQLAGRLYCFHRVAISRRWVDAYPGPDVVRALVERSASVRDWVLLDYEQAAHWLSWHRRGGRPDAPASDYPYKLYVSPAVDALADMLPGLIGALAATSVARFKVGANAAGLLRPDKIVVYVRDVNELERVAATVAATLNGARPHGVPFSAELYGDGLLSWGGDPAADAGPVGSGPESWRLSVCRRLAQHLAAAQRAPLRRVRPAEFALARLALDGVDVRSFAPTGLTAPSNVGV